MSDPTASDIYAQVSALVANFNACLAQIPTYESGSPTGGAANSDGTGTGGPFYPLTDMSGAQKWLRGVQWYLAQAAACVPSTGGTFTGDVNVTGQLSLTSLGVRIDGVIALFNDGAGNVGVNAAAGKGVFAQVNGTTVAQFTASSATLSTPLQVGGAPPTGGTLNSVSGSGGVSLAVSDNANSSFYVAHPPNGFGGPVIGGDGSSALNFAAGVPTRANVKFVVNTTAAHPGADNTYALGTASVRFSTLYAGTSSINTSDAREKTVRGALTDAELRVAKRCASLVKVYQWNDAIAEKGSNRARLHVGVIAQDVRDAFVAEGLDGTRYGIVCFDSWDATPAVPAVQAVTAVPAVLDEDGKVVTPAVRGVEAQPAQAAKPAADRWGVRLDELGLLITAAQEQRLLALEAKAA